MSYLYKLVTTDNVELNYNAFKKSELIECVVDLRSSYFRQKEENQELKKQLKPNYYVNGLEGSLKEYQEEVKKYNSQQKEFIEHLEAEIERLDSRWKQFAVRLNRPKDVLPRIESKEKAYEEILSKYKEIIHFPDNGEL